MSDFDFLDNLVPDKKEETPIFKLDTKKELMESSPEVNESKPSDLDMTPVLYTEVKRIRRYQCVIVNKQVLSQAKLPILFYETVNKLALETAKELHGNLMRADKAMEGLKKIGFPDDGKVLLTHKRKSVEKILNERRREIAEEKAKNETLKEVALFYSTGRREYIRNKDLNAETKQRISNLLWKDEKIVALEENKFIVFPIKYILTSPDSLAIHQAIGIIERAIDKERAKVGKPPISSNKYWVVNQDEPYFEEIKQITLRGESNKQK